MEGYAVVDVETGLRDFLLRGDPAVTARAR